MPNVLWMLFNALDVFVVATLLFQLSVQHISAALPCKRFVNKRL